MSRSTGALLIPLQGRAGNPAAFAECTPQRQPPGLALCWLHAAAQPFLPDLPRSGTSHYFHLHREKYFWSREHRQPFRKSTRRVPSAIREATLITAIREISSDCCEERGERLRLGLCNQGRDSISLRDTAGAQTEDLADSTVPSGIYLVPPLKADQRTSSAATFTRELSAARCGRPGPGPPCQPRQQALGCGAQQPAVSRADGTRAQASLAL